jgi:hypothetical protein
MNYKFSFAVYQNKFKSVPGLVAFLLILLFIVLIPVIFVLILGAGIGFMLFSGIVGLFIPKRKETKKLKEIRTIEVFEEKQSH